jgi:hypothetical protein
VQPLERRVEPVEIAVPPEPVDAHADRGDAPRLGPSQAPRAPVDTRPKMPDPYRRQVGAVLLTFGAISFAGVIVAQAFPPLRWRDCTFIPDDALRNGRLTGRTQPQGTSIVGCPRSTFAIVAHPVAMLGTVTASLLTGLGSARFGEAHGVHRMRQGRAPRSGVVRLAIGGTLTAIGILGVFASIFGPDARSGTCDDNDCLIRLRIASSIGVSVAATSAVVGSGLLGHAFGERRAARRPGHIAYGLGVDARGVQLSATARF